MATEVSVVYARIEWLNNIEHIVLRIFLCVGANFIDSVRVTKSSDFEAAPSVNLSVESPRNW